MTDIDYWRTFLTRWSHEWADAQDPDAPEDERLAGHEEVLRTRWLGLPPAPEERILALEGRLGHRLPPSYRSFLRVSDGWRHAGGFVWLLAGTAQVRWHQDAAGLSEWYPGEPDDEPGAEHAVPAGMWDRALQLDVESDAVHLLMDPGDVDAGGEWAVYSWASWRASPPERYASFRAFMEDMYREFHTLEADRAGRTGRAFVNDTTRALDASVEEARLTALRGRYAQAEATLAEALAYGRPRAAGLRDQIRRLLGHTYTVSFHGLTTDPLYAPEVLPVLAAEHVTAHRHDSSWAYHLGGNPALAGTADAILRDVREGTYRYTPDGPFGRAVAQAREQARWGDTDGAWHTLCAALPEWRPVGPEHIAPVGLCADPLLGPLLTPERGRELLAVPRAGQRGARPAPVAGADPPGLAWLTELDPGHVLSSSYRFVLVEGVEPAELPGRVGADGAGVLTGPTTLWESRMHPRGGAKAAEWEDRARAAVGRAGDGWSFALEACPGTGFAEKWFVSPGVAASHGTRAVTVWSEPSDGHRPGVFHLSVAERGEERYAFTVRGTAVGVRGSVPAALDPERLFRPEDPPAGRLGERRALEALAAEYGVRLPRFALTLGRLHTFLTGPWNRPPGPGEGYATLRFVRTRP
ncbi:SMI1/KNR4 family protein [Streptomyces capoamus]|nr:SMI1/KNR4 family protein [Streptomyces capoamus]